MPVSRRLNNGRRGSLPFPLPCFLEVLIPEGLERNFPEVLILVGLKSFRITVLRALLGVLITRELRRDFSEVLILEGLSVCAKKAADGAGEILSGARVRSNFMREHSACSTTVSTDI